MGIDAPGRVAGVPWAGFHSLRHTCASMLFRAGRNAKQVQVVLGHHSPAFTLATHVHLIPEDLPEPVFPVNFAGEPAGPPKQVTGDPGKDMTGDEQARARQNTCIAEWR